MRSTGRSTKTATSALAAAVAAAALLSACGSDPEQDVPGPNYATVTGAGRKVDVPANLERREYPNACRLLPNNSVQALVGAPVTSGRTTAGCSWTAGVASLPTVAIQFVEIGSDALSVYTQRRPGGSTARSIPKLGSRARVYRVNKNMTTRVDVYKPRAFFCVEVGTTDTSPQDLDNAEQIATRVAQLVAEQVS